jgi:indolepyruvate ferredoxin oxidoreductase beta subunit
MGKENVNTTNDPPPFQQLNIIVAGIGGQGSLASAKILGKHYSHKGYTVTIGETFGASQRGGSVTSHLRISNSFSLPPQIPNGQGHIIIALEPYEAILALKKYGNSKIKILCNRRFNFSGRTFERKGQKVSTETIIDALKHLSADCHLLNATKLAINAFNIPIYANSIMIGAAHALGWISISKSQFKSVISDVIPRNLVEDNLKAYEIGTCNIREQIENT